MRISWGTFPACLGMIQSCPTLTARTPYRLTASRKRAVIQVLASIVREITVTFENQPPGDSSRFLREPDASAFRLIRRPFLERWLLDSLIVLLNTTRQL